MNVTSNKVIWHRIHRIRAESDVCHGCCTVNLALRDAALATDELFTRRALRFEPHAEWGMRAAA